MTDAEADDWFTEHAECTMERGTSMMSFQLWRKGRRAEGDDTVGFVLPENMPPPDVLDTRRFLVRWFVRAFGKDPRPLAS
jgi:hypothetical protein